MSRKRRKDCLIKKARLEGYLEGLRDAVRACEKAAAKNCNLGVVVVECIHAIRELGTGIGSPSSRGPLGLD